ncbi:MAG: autotransporter-associated beta strand repeat-containing protein, partial [Candidatus Latescibacterota bacterium]
ANTLTIGGVISGGQAINKAGAGKLILTGSNTFTGALNVVAGTCTLQNTTAAGSIAGGVVVSAGASLELQGSITVDAEPLTLNGGAANELVNVSGSNSWTGPVTLATGAADIVVTANTLTIGGVISGGQAINKAGAGSLTFSGANTYTGATSINAGGLITSTADRIADVSNVILANVAGAELTLGGAETIGSLSGGGTTGGNINLNTFVLTVTQSAALTYGGVISGTGGLTKVGASALTLSGVNTYTGVTAINAGGIITNAAERIADSSNVVLADAVGVVMTLGGNETIGSLSGGGTTGGNIALGTFTLTVNQSSALTYGGIISGTGGLTKAGASTLTLSGANTYTGVTTINAGGLTTNAAERIANTSNVILADVVGAELTFGGAETIGSLSGGGTSGGNINLGAFTLTVTQGAALTYSGIISGTGGLTKAGTSALTLGGANTYTGVTTINAGGLNTNADERIADTSNVVLANVANAVLTLGGAERIGSLSGGGTTGGNIAVGTFILTVTQTAALTYGGIISGAGGLTKAGSETLTISGANTYTGPTTISEGALTTSAASRIADVSDVIFADAAGVVLTLGGAETIGSLSGGGTFGGNIAIGAFTLTVTQNAPKLYNGVISGTGGLTKAGFQTLTLGGANTYTGVTTINAGGLSTGSSERISDTSDIVLANTAGAVLTLGGAETIRSLSGGGTTGGNINLATFTLTVTQSAALTYGGIIGGAGGLTKAGASVLTLSGANCYTGPTTINAGGLRTSAADKIGDMSDVILADAAGVVLTLGGAETVGSLSGGGTTGGNIALGTFTLTVTQGAAMTYGGIISGTGGLTKAGTSTLTLSGANTFTGATIINEGSLSTNAAERIANTSNVIIANVVGAELDIGGVETIGSLSGGGTSGGNINLGAFTLTVTQSAALTYSGIISGTGGLTKVGASALTLSGANTYSGQTTINAGSLMTSGAERIADTSDVVLANVAGVGLALGGNETIGSLSGGGTTGGNIAVGTFILTVTQTAALTYGGIISGAGGLTKAGGAELTLSGASTYTGVTTINAGSLKTSAANRIADTSNFFLANIAGAVLTLGGNETIGSLSGGGTSGGNINLGIFTLTVTQSTTLTYGGIISGTGGLTKAGGSVLTLNGANTFSGALNVTAGTCNLQNDTASGTTAGGILVSSGASLELQGGITVGDESLTLNGGAANELVNVNGSNSWAGDISLATAVADVMVTAGSLTISGAISGGQGINKSGAGALILSGANSYTGTTTISSGALMTGVAERIADVGDVVLANIDGAVLTLGGNETIRSLSGGGTIGGNINLDAFTLTVTQSAALTYGGVISGTGGLTKGGASRLTLTGANIFTGAVNVNAGPLNIQHATAAGTESGGVVVAAGASLEVQGGIAVGAEPLSLNGGAANELVNVSGSNSWSGTVALATAAVDIVVTADSLSINGIISGGQAINKAGAGKMILTGANTFTGALNITAGTCNLRNSSAAGMFVGGVVVSGGASLQLENNIAIGPEPLTLNGGAATELENVSGTNSWGGTVTLALAAVDIKSTAGVLTLYSNVSGQSLTFNCTTGNIVVSDAVGAGGAQTLTKNGTGVLTLNGNCNFTGGTTINAGVVNFNGNNIALGAVVANNSGTKIAGTGILPAASSVTMNNLTIISPGDNNGDDVGTITINGNLTFNFESKYIVTVAGASGADKIICNGNIIASGNTPNIEINTHNTSGFVYPAAIITLTGTYAKFDESSLPSGWDIDDTKVGNDIRITMATLIVPMFTGWGLIIFALLIASLAIRRMRDKSGRQNISFK